jgi:hypothetical protein
MGCRTGNLKRKVKTMRRKHLPIPLLAIVMIVLAAAPVLAADPAAAPFTVSRLVVATGIDNRLPTGAAEAFPASTEKLYLFLEASAISADTDVVFAWFIGDREVHRYTLPVKQGPLWRTWAECSLRGRAGEWKAEVLVGDKPLQAVSFKVE